MVRGRPSAVLALLLGSRAAATAAEASAEALASLTPSALREDDECDAQADGEKCGLNALQLRASGAAARERQEEGTEATSVAEAQVGTTVGGIWHYALNCYYHCGSTAGYCSSYCGPGNACCKYLNSADPPECHTVRFWPVRHIHTCVKPNMPSSGPGTDDDVDYSSFTPSPSSADSSTGSAPSPAALIFRNPKLYKPSDAPVMKFYVYRVQSEDNYAPENQNMGNLPGIMWYLHNEIVWHPHLKRSGTYFSTSKTRIEKFRVHVRATQPLYDLGMNFAVVNAFDSTKCTGPYHCANFAEFGYAVGCETWKKGSGSDFPHGQWDGKNKYNGAVWYSLPGPCSSKGLGKKTKDCILSEPGGACVMGGIPTGTGDCTYTYEKVSEISIDELEGIEDEASFKKMGGMEYDTRRDKGYLNSFWDNKYSEEACTKRVEKAEALFKEKSPALEDLPDPTCDFKKWRLEKALHMAQR